ncbi:MAG: hypothetical protein M1831_004041 [Alyxoria varia]|nr:MAG: hypothetical protein M1831_004041 [Alyxoria varia]
MSLLPDTNNNSSNTLPMTPEDTEQLQLLDHDIERIRKHTPNKPYIVSLPVEPHNAFNLSSSHAFDWKVFTHFDRNEEHLHYASFLYRDPSTTLMRQTAQLEDSDEVEKPKPGSLAPSRPHTPSQNQAKKKISWAAYKNNKLKSQNGTPTAGCNPERINMETPNHNAAPEVHESKVPSEQAKPNEESQENRLDADDKGAEERVSKSPKRTHEEMNHAQPKSSESQSTEPPLKRSKINADRNKYLSGSSVPNPQGQKKANSERAEGEGVRGASPAGLAQSPNQNLTIANGSASKDSRSTTPIKKDGAKVGKDHTKDSRNDMGGIATSNGLKEAQRSNTLPRQREHQSMSERQTLSRNEANSLKANVSASKSTGKPEKSTAEAPLQQSAKSTTPQIKVDHASNVQESLDSKKPLSQPDQSRSSNRKREYGSKKPRIDEDHFSTTPMISSLRQHMKFGQEVDIQDLTELRIRLKRKGNADTPDKPSKIVKLKYARRRSTDSMKTLRMRSLSNKENIAAQQNEASSKQPTYSGRPLHRPFPERDTDGDSKRRRLHSSSINSETPRTPQKVVKANSPAVSVTTPMSSTKAVTSKTVKSMLNGVTNGPSSISATPVTGATPSSLQHAVSTHSTPETAKKHLFKQLSSSSIATDNMTTTTISIDAWKAEHQRLQTLGKDLKHSADKILNNLPEATANSKEHRHQREVGTLTALESILSFMQAFSAEDQCHSEGYYQSWSSLPNFLRYVGETVRACQDERLYGMYMLLKGVCTSTLAGRMGAEMWLSALNEKDGGEQAARKKSEHLVSVARYTRQSADAAKAVQSSIPAEVWRDEYPKACTVKERESPIVGWMTPIGAARVGLVFLEEWAEKKKIKGWKARLGEDGEGLCAHL